MKRSQINDQIKKGSAFIAEHQFFLPEFCSWTPEQWKTKGHECDEIRENMLGWDLTDYSQGDFSKIGLLLITLRNGNQKMPEKYGKTYAEKLMLINEDQITPMHFHWHKMEDIINRGGGNLIIKLYNSTADEGLADTDVTVSIDGVKHTFPAGYEVKLLPGQSITLPQRVYHRFWGESGCGMVLAGEVSMCNDDSNDNRFYDPVGRFPDIDEDEPPFRLLCNEYPAAR